MEKMVSIWCISYNHEDYIRDALEGFVKQKTNFRFEVIVYDDASTDRTADILREYKERYPHIFTLYLSKYNRWREKGNRQFFYKLKKEKLNAKYVALCEGDDYWTDENKLQMQVDYMEEHPECSMYIHNAIWKDYVKNTEKPVNPFDVDGECDIPTEMLIEQKKGHPPTASFLYRRELLEKDFFFFDASVGDYTLLLCAAAHGKVHYNSRTMAVYRFNTPGSYTRSMQENEIINNYYSIGLISFLVQYNTYINSRYEKSIMYKLSILLGGLADKYSSKDVSVELLYNNCIENGYYLSEDCKRIFSGIQTFIDVRKMWYLTENAKRFISHYKHLVIMGTGNYANLLTKQLEYYEIAFEGYAVTNPDKDETCFNNKPVWRLKEIPFEKDDTGILIGILIVDKEDIINSLKDANIDNYYMPFKINIFN